MNTIIRAIASTSGQTKIGPPWANIRIEEQASIVPAASLAVALAVIGLLASVVALAIRGHRDRKWREETERELNRLPNAGLPMDFYIRSYNENIDSEGAPRDTRLSILTSEGWEPIEGLTTDEAAETVQWWLHTQTREATAAALWIQDGPIAGRAGVRSWRKQHVIDVANIRQMKVEETDTRTGYWTNVDPASNERTAWLPNWHNPEGGRP